MSMARDSSQTRRALAPKFGELMKQVVLIGSAVAFYFLVRGQTEGSVSEAVENGLWILDLEGDVGIDVERSMQMWTDSNGLTTLANWIYIWLHWPVIIVTLLWLHHTRVETYLLLRNAMFASGAIGLVFYVLLPVAPPRLLDVGFVDTITEYSTSYRVLQPPAFINKYAAMPSLHVGWNLLIGVFLYQASERRSVRCLALVGPMLMALAVVVTANHYVLDGVVGTAVAVVGLFISSRVTSPLIRVDKHLRDAVRGL